MFVVDYQLGTPLKVAVTIFDENMKRQNKTMGSTLLDIGEVLGARGNTKAKKLGGGGGGTLFAHVRPHRGSGTLRLRLQGVGLKNVEGGLFRGKSDPFYEISRQINSAGGNTWDNVYRSAPVKNSLDPQWDDATLELSTLCGGDLDQPLKIAVLDHESSGRHVGMGTCETTVRALVAAAAGASPDRPAELVLTKKGQAVGKIAVVVATVSGHDADGRGDHDVSGKPAMVVSPAAVSAIHQLAAMKISPSLASASPQPPPSLKPTFADYVSGGCAINVTVAIDFTGSNGDPRKPGTLHYMDKNSKNDYEKAISAVLGILKQFDADQQFQVVGFGAKFGGVVKHCFQVGPSETVSGVEGVLNAYNHVFESGLVMSSPTVFTEVINRVASQCAQANVRARQRGGLAYSVLLIVTDGAVSDVEATAKCLRLISSYPMSVVIVGVGNADFSTMQFLDDNRANQGFRDMAQFVPFNQHCGSPAELTSETLKEIPRQLEECFHAYKYPAGPPIVVKDEEIVVEAEEEQEIDLRLDVSDEGEIVVAGGGTACQSTF